MEYVLYVKAEDQNGREGRKYQSTPEERLSIVGGKRPPQVNLHNIFTVDDSMIKNKAKTVVRLLAGC